MDRWWEESEVARKLVKLERKRQGARRRAGRWYERWKRKGIEKAWARDPLKVGEVMRGIVKRVEESGGVADAVVLEAVRRLVLRDEEWRLRKEVRRSRRKLERLVMAYEFGMGVDAACEVAGYGVESGKKWLRRLGVVRGTGRVGTARKVLLAQEVVRRWGEERVARVLGMRVEEVRMRAGLAEEVWW